MSEALIKARERHVEWLLDAIDKGRLKIPAYQRPYEWSVENNRALFEDLTSDDNYHDIAGEKHYFLGPIYTRNKDLLDGQQRATSLVIWNNAEGAAQDYYCKWLQVVNDRIQALQTAYQRLQRYEETIHEQLHQAKEFVTADLKAKLQAEGIDIGNKLLYKPLTSPKAYVERLKNLEEAIKNALKSKSGTSKDIQASFSSLGTIVKQIDLSCIDDGVQEIKKCKDRLKHETTSLFFVKKKDLFRSKTAVSSAITNAESLVHEYQDVIADLGEATDCLHAKENARISIQCENHVTDFSPLEDLWLSLLSGNFRLRKTKRPQQRDSVFELEVEIYGIPNVDNAALASSDLLLSWWPNEKEKPEAYFVSLKSILKEIQKNARLAPFQQRYLSGFVFYFFKSFGTILDRINFPFTDDDRISPLTVELKRCTGASLEKLRNQVRIVEMELFEDLQMGDAQRMFHTINSRGVSLSDADKVRNLLLSHSRKAQVTEAFTDLVVMFQMASKSNLNLGFAEDDVFYWAHHFIKGGGITQKEFISDVEHNLESRPESGYEDEFIEYMQGFSRFVQWLCLEKSLEEKDYNIWSEFRFVLLLNFPKASYPLLYALYQNFHGKLSVNEDRNRYAILVRGVGYFLAKRRDTTFIQLASKTESISALLKRTLKAVHTVKIADGKLSDQLVEIAKYWFPRSLPKQSDGTLGSTATLLVRGKSKSKFATKVVFEQALSQLNEPRFYGTSNVNAMTKYILTSTATGIGENVVWHSDLEHLYHAQSSNHPSGNRLGNIFLLPPRLNRAMGNLIAEKKLEELEKRIKEGDSAIQSLAVYKWLNTQFVTNGVPWSDEPKVTQLFKDREVMISRELKKRSEMWYEEIEGF